MYRENDEEDEHLNDLELFVFCVRRRGCGKRVLAAWETRVGGRANHGQSGVSGVHDGT